MQDSTLPQHLIDTVNLKTNAKIQKKINITFCHRETVSFVINKKYKNTQICVNYAACYGHTLTVILITFPYYNVVQFYTKDTTPRQDSYDPLRSQ